MRWHEQLKEINDTIWYESEFEYNPAWFNSGIVWFYERTWYERRYVNVAEMIFNPEFMDKYILYAYNKNILEMNKTYDSHKFSIWLLSNLDEPELYLYNLLQLWKH